MPESSNSTGPWDRLILALERIALKALVTGNFVWFVILVIGGGCVWKLQPEDLKEVLLKVFSAYGWLGYIVAGVVIFVCVRVLGWRERIHQQEIDRITKVRDQAVQAKLDLPIRS